MQNSQYSSYSPFDQECLLPWGGICHSIGLQISPKRRCIILQKAPATFSKKDLRETSKEQIQAFPQDILLLKMCVSKTCFLQKTCSVTLIISNPHSRSGCCIPIIRAYTSIVGSIDAMLTYNTLFINKCRITPMMSR